MKAAICVGLGGALGGVLRYGIDWSILTVFSGGALIGTFVANSIGSFLVGLFLVASLKRAVSGDSPRSADDSVEPFWIFGFCGGLTTFSAFNAHILELVQDGEGTLAGAYAAFGLVVGLFCVGAGLLAGQRTQAAIFNKNE